LNKPASAARAERAVFPVIFQILKSFWWEGIVIARQQISLPRMSLSGFSDLRFGDPPHQYPSMPIDLVENCPTLFRFLVWGKQLFVIFHRV
jgi:hypothetical protein